MAGPSPINPLGSIIRRQYDEKTSLKNSLFKERLNRAKNLYRKDLFAHYGCVNAIEFSEEGELLVSGGDDRRVLLWSVPEAIHDRSRPICMQTSHVSNIFCLAFDSTNSTIFSGGNDDQVIVHDANTGHLVVKLPHRKPVYGLSIHPQNDCILSTAGDDGRILIYDIREQTNEPTCFAKQKTGFHSVMYNPINTELLVTANSEEGIKLWDTRKPKEALIHYDSDLGPISGISACFNSNGKNVLALRRRLPPVLYNTNKRNAICQFYHPKYYNSCTMKTCSFAGLNDEYILSGSDDFNLYMWKIPQDDCEWGNIHMILKGHRSIVNQVRYNKQNNLIASSGVEKMVKLWSTVPVGTWTGALLKEHTERGRPIYSHDDYIFLVGHAGQRISHDYSEQSVLEDTRMLAFFDSLIQREIEGWVSPSDLSASSDSEQEMTENNRKFWDVMKYRVMDEKSRKHKPNKIAQLIAKKRHTLAKMARWRASSYIQRSHEKLKERYLKRKSQTQARKQAKNNGVSKKLSNGKHSKRSSSLNSNGRDSTANSSSSSSRRHHKTEENDEERHRRSKKSWARQNLRSLSEDNSLSNTFDTPSTSTGITASGSTVFRVIEQDSDDEAPTNNCTENNNVSEDNFVNILPTPLNGSHDMYISLLEMSNSTNGNVVTLRNEELPPNQASSSGNQVNLENCASFTNEADFHNSLEVYINGCAGTSYISDTDSNSELHFTPVRVSRHTNVSEMDSGFATGACSSNSAKRNRPSCSTKSNGATYSSEDDDYPYETFKKRVKKDRLNIRKQICRDSDSN